MQFSRQKIIALKAGSGEIKKAQAGVKAQCELYYRGFKAGRCCLAQIDLEGFQNNQKEMIEGAALSASEAKRVLDQQGESNHTLFRYQRREKRRKQKRRQQKKERTVISTSTLETNSSYQCLKKLHILMLSLIHL
eukprot:TRINITY_DN19934_c0_g1_i1.p1 TRINITY_DN19934_c0_g1~~TRINITY_DN19934_c0_g1_i1.p1  ORF type:complete len:135 (-),score=11.68 TRINITY_DN19934_c0_g1_i1:17-421(-)